ncbi:MAG: RraA family protein [Planctomycetota bacterium]
MRLSSFFVLALSGAAVLASWSSEAPPSAPTKGEPADLEALRAGKGFIPTPVTTESEDAKILAEFRGLRVADVVDALDKAGLQGIGVMSPEIRALWKDAARFSHRFAGIAVTARYVPTQEPPAGSMAPDDYDRWASRWYASRSPEPFVPLVRPGTALVIEDAPDADAGTIGSNNILSWKLRGCAGVVTSAAARDLDEIEAERVPLYFRRPGRGIRPGRNEIESVNRPVVCGGVLVVPGDVVVADGDGVVVVPRARAEEVARHAREILEGDKASRRALYRKLGIPEDDSVR